jgi:protein-S-isoprenylcysteine O-methyltransferase Ste14
MTEPKSESLKSRLLFGFPKGVIMWIATLFLPAGSIKFWEGWVFIATLAVGNLFTTIYFRHDRQLVDRRLESEETESAQRLFRILWTPLWIAGQLICGLDFRFRWSAAVFGGVPLGLVLSAQALSAVSYFITFQVLKANRFAASVVQVEAGQEVISTGPYRLVRHPMYSAFALQALSMPLALASYFAIPVFMLLIPLLIVRVLNEEKVLRQNLPGYAEYCSHTRFRLIPFLV